MLGDGPESKRRELEVEVLALTLGHRSRVTLRARHGDLSTDHVELACWEVHTEKVETVRGGRMAAIAKVVPGWSRTSSSTGLPHRTKRGTWGSLIRASVTATTGAARSCSPALSSSQSNART